MTIFIGLVPPFLSTLQWGTFDTSGQSYVTWKYPINLQQSLLFIGGTRFTNQELTAAIGVDANRGLSQTTFYTSTSGSFYAFLIGR